MKLTKLLLLVPAFAMVACSGDKPSSEPVDPTVISEAEFTAIFQDLKLFKEDNFSLKTEVSHGFVAITEGDAGKIKFYEYEEDLDPTDADYMEFLENGKIDYIDYDDGEWEREEITFAQAKDLAFQNSAFLPFEYKDLVRLEETKEYVIDEVAMDNGGGDTIIFTDIHFAFKDNKPTKITFDFTFEEHQEEKDSMILTFTYGGVTVVIPE